MLNLEPATLFSRIIILVIAFTFHEFSHAWVATYFGDDTPRLNGRLTLNPLAHLDVMGSLMLIFAGFGWAKPVPVNPYQLKRRSPAAFMLVSIAGPLSNFLLATIAALPLRFQWIPFRASGSAWIPSISMFLLEFIIINLALMLFNLIPLAPLDGEKVFEYFSPPPVARAMETIRPYGPMILLLIIFLGPVFGVDIFGLIIGPPITAIFKLLVGVPG